MMTTTMISIITIVLIHTLFSVGFSNDLPLTTISPQLPTPIVPSNPYSSYESLEESRKKSPSPKKKSPPPPSSPLSPPPSPPPLLFDHFKLAETWPPTYCKIYNNSCVSPDPLKFVIHGLWPNKIDDEVKNCDKQVINLTKFDPLMEKLSKDWPALKLDKYNNQKIVNLQLWSYQWNTHGTCSIQLFNFTSYFEETLKVYNRYNIRDILEKSNITKGGVFKQKEYINAIKKHIKFTPQIRCEQIGKLYYLYEIRFCLTASKNLEYQDCAKPYSGCNSTTNDVYF
ncbi:ribonuclease MC-like [Vicia villosa]|uniref:ribonuclease MC-like n=1 Tax=Vicia villosa TaxID=3911 RepID=UPI00273CDC2B|nr:ribonuclease MC-like [Vicia villosa]